MKHSNASFVKELGLDQSFFEDFSKLDRKKFRGQYTDTERNFLYHFIKYIRPNGVVEFSSGCGYTSAIMCQALQDASIVPEYFFTYEFEPTAAIMTTSNLTNLHLDFDTNVIFANVLEYMNVDKLKRTDVLFIDSNHERRFVELYVKMFFECLKKGAWVAVHDIAFSPINDETEIIFNYLEKEKIKNYFFLPDVLAHLNLSDDGINILNRDNVVKEHSTSFWFRV